MKGDFVVCNRRREDIFDLLLWNYEEVDLRFVFYVVDVVKFGFKKVILRIVDIVVVILVFVIFYDFFLFEFWVVFGVGKYLWYVLVLLFFVWVIRNWGIYLYFIVLLDVIRYFYLLV